VTLIPGLSSRCLVIAPSWKRFTQWCQEGHLDLAEARYVHHRLGLYAIDGASVTIVDADECGTSLVNEALAMQAAGRVSIRYEETP